MNEKSHKSPRGSALRCAQCGSAEVRTENIQEEFTYGESSEAVQLSAVVPLRRCLQCGFAFIDAAGEDAQHEAICRHLRVMTPREIRALRRRYGLTRSQFALVTKLGAATIARWERGELIQNAAYDQFLYLLTFAENLERLRERNDGRPSTDCPGGQDTPPPRFRLIHPTNR